MCRILLSLSRLTVALAEARYHLWNQRLRHQIGLSSAIGGQRMDVDSGRLLDNFSLSQGGPKVVAEGDQTVILQNHRRCFRGENLEHALTEVRRTGQPVAGDRHRGAYYKAGLGQNRRQKRS